MKNNLPAEQVTLLDNRFVVFVKSAFFEQNCSLKTEHACPGNECISLSASFQAFRKQEQALSSLLESLKWRV
jgi:hypothetical protein